MRRKERVTVTIDSELIEAANKAVSEGRVASSPRTGIFIVTSDATDIEALARAAGRPVDLVET
jgi:hypothetical protein